MFVNANAFPGPALWQGVMLCLLPLLMWGMVWATEHATFKQRIGRLLIGAYVAIGVGLFVWIVWG